MPEVLRQSRAGTYNFAGRKAFCSTSFTDLVYVLDILKKFAELQWLERERLSQWSLDGADSSHQWPQDSDPEIKPRNRYFNVLPWANNRIHQRVPPGHRAYINASPRV